MVLSMVCWLGRLTINSGERGFESWNSLLNSSLWRAGRRAHCHSLTTLPGGHTWLGGAQSVPLMPPQRNEDFWWPLPTLTPDQVPLAGRTVPVISFYCPGTGLTMWDKRTGGAPFANFWPLSHKISVEWEGVRGEFQNSEAAYQALKWWHHEPTRCAFEACGGTGVSGGEAAFQLKRRCECDESLAGWAAPKLGGQAWPPPYHSGSTGMATSLSNRRHCHKQLSPPIHAWRHRCPQATAPLVARRSSSKRCLQCLG